MTDRDALLASVLATPDDDAPRLVYADWCDEQAGQRGESTPCPRAELIRVQIAAVRTGEPHAADPVGKEIVGRRWLEDGDPSDRRPCPCKSCTLRRRGSDLLAEIGDDDWPPAELEEVGWRFVRGFIEFVQVTAADWLAHADAILAAHPVTEVRLTTRLQWDVCSAYAGIRSGDSLLRAVHLAGLGKSEKDVLADRWPSVRTWHLPPEREETTPAPAPRPARLLRNIGTHADPVWVEIGSPESVEADLAAAREAGIRAGMDRERRALEAFIAGTGVAADRVRQFAAAHGRPQRPSRSPTCRYARWGVPPRTPPR